MNSAQIRQLRYRGYRATPALWEGGVVSPFPQISLPGHAAQIDTSAPFKNHRLGKLVEEFVFHQLQASPAVDWICDSLQIHQDKRTVGEIDALYYDHGIPVHLEVAYKFYLYDTLESHTAPLACWIGPNRKDNLSLKLSKLNDKQFPLLHNPLTAVYLEAHGLHAESFKQQLCFLGQLFLPYHNRGIDVSPLNPECVAGFHLSYLELEPLKTHKFYIPAKLDWLTTPHQAVDWVSYEAAILRIKSYIADRRSPLVWLKDANGELSKCFVVFW